MKAKARMPIERIDDVAPGVRLGLWRMTEAVGQLPKPQGVDLSGVRSESRIREKIVSHLLLRNLTGRTSLSICHEQSGKPVVDGCEISLSHTRGWAAMIVAPHGLDVGVDIEYFSERVNRIADRFIRPDEQNGDLPHRLVNWSVKETVYKLFSEEDLQYFDMRLHPFDALPKGEVVVDDLKTGRSVSVNYVLTADYVLSWAVFYHFFNKIKQK